MQESSDTFDWIIGSGGTQSYFTGPKTDHTTQSTGGNRLYIITNFQTNPNTSRLNPGQSEKIKFLFHFYL